jgi:hypothetical protein
MGDGYQDKDGNTVKFSESTGAAADHRPAIDVTLLWAAQSGGTWAADSDRGIFQASELEPFRTMNNVYWTSKDARLWHNGGIQQGMFHSGQSKYDPVLTPLSQGIHTLRLTVFRLTKPYLRTTKSA